VPALPNASPQVVSVDCNPAQSALLELKKVAIQQLEFEDVWQVGGGGQRAWKLVKTRRTPRRSTAGKGENRREGKGRGA
jgi:hypothetical protein